MIRVLVLGLALAACTKTAVDPDATAIEIATTIDAADGITQLKVSGTVHGQSVFEPGLLPEAPRLLDGRQTAVVLLPETLSGDELLVRVDALAGDQLVHSGGATITIRANELVPVDIDLGEAAICGDGKVTSPVETCDDSNAANLDGCSKTCFVETGFTCVGSPSECGPTHKEITAFAFLPIANPSLSAPVIATINGTAIAATVPNGTDIRGLVATFAMTGQSARVGAALQVSGATPNDFSQPVVYTITSEDGATKKYTVTVTVASSDAKDIMAFRILAANNPGLGVDVTATINGTGIAATMPAGTNLNGLVATFDATGINVKVGATVQISGTTANDFRTTVTYTVTASNLTTKDYTVDIVAAKSSSKSLTSFVFTAIANPILPMDIPATINGTTITAILPSNANLSMLVPSFESTGMSVSVGGVTQTSGTSVQDFTNPVLYTVTAADMTTQTYTVTITLAAGSAKEITSFAFMSADNPTLTADVPATIVGTSITAKVPFGTDVSALVATFATTGASVTVNAVPQTSGITANNFGAPVAYVVTATDSSTSTYTVTVTIAASNEKDITAFSFLSVKNPGLPADVIGAIAGTTITLTVPAGTDKTALVATFTTTGKVVKVGNKAQHSGITANNFTNTVIYTVTAQDLSTKQYTVIVN